MKSSWESKCEFQLTTGKCVCKILKRFKLNRKWDKSQRLRKTWETSVHEKEVPDMVNSTKAEQFPLVTSVPHLNSENFIALLRIPSYAGKYNSFRISLHLCLFIN